MATLTTREYRQRLKKCAEMVRYIQTQHFKELLENAPVNAAITERLMAAETDLISVAVTLERLAKD